MVFNGDDAQCDRYNSDGYGMKYLRRLLTNINDIGVVDFKQKINERHPLITDILQKVIDLNLEENQLNETRKRIYLTEIPQVAFNKG
jgi:phosphate starvation-inducible protein PhoH